MEKIQSIDTNYKGYYFRSRLEARWAVYFDSLGIDYIYEPQGFFLDDGSKYLPDFYLPDFKTFVEVKGDFLDSFDYNRAKRLVKQTNLPLIILDRDPSLKHVTQMFLNEKGEFQLREVNLIEDPKNKGSFIISKFLVDKEDYDLKNLIAPVEAVKTSRKERFGV